MLIAIDPGHGGRDKGASYFGIDEKDINLAISFYLGYELQLKNHEVIFTRSTDTTVSLKTRIQKIIEHNPDLFISIHCDAFNNSKVVGMTTFTRKNCNKTEIILSNEISHSLQSFFPDHRHRGIKEANFYVLINNPFSAILVECEFLSNSIQNNFLRKPENQIRLAKSIARGILTCEEI